MVGTLNNYIIYHRLVVVLDLGFLNQLNSMHTYNITKKKKKKEESIGTWLTKLAHVHHTRPNTEKSQIHSDTEGLSKSPSLLHYSPSQLSLYHKNGSRESV